MGLVVFISYATPDSSRYKIPEIAEELKKYSEIDNVLYWEEHLHDDIFKYMNDNLGLCDTLLVFCSPSADVSEAVQLEWMSALKLKKKVIPVFSDPKDIPPLLTTKLGVMFEEDLSRTVEKIYELILKKQKEITIIKDKEEQVEQYELEKLTELVARAIFTNQKEIVLGKYQYWVKTYRSSGVKFINIKPYRFLQQNPYKKSEYAQMAKQGKKILWILKNGHYHARWIDGTFNYIGD